MRILRLIPFFLPNITGPIKQAYSISYGLEKREISSPIFTSDYRAYKSPKIEVLEGIQVNRFKSCLSFMQYFLTPSLLSALKKEEFDMIHAHCYRNFQSDMGFLFSKTKNKPFIISPHGSIYIHKYALSNRIYRIPYYLYDSLSFKKILKDSDAVIASTKQEQQECIDFGIEEGKIHIIPAGVDLEKFENVEVEKDKNIINILFIGRISRDRRVESIIDAFKLLQDKGNLKLTIVGGEEKRSALQKSGYIEELKEKILRLGLQNKIDFLGVKYGANLVKCYKSADIFVYTSDYENFGQTILEAAASGLPIVSTPVGIANDIVFDNETGFIVSNDPEIIAAKIVTLVNDDNLRKKCGKNLIDFVRKNYVWEKIIDKYIEIYESLLKR